jgi:hypothetical protein
MKSILVVFAVLLLLLTLLGAFGGSIQYAEPFFEVAEDEKEQVYSPQTEFYTQPTMSMPPPPVGMEMLQAPKLSTPNPLMMPVTGEHKVTSEQFEAFSIEPFEEDEKTSLPAAY